MSVSDGDGLGGLGDAGTSPHVTIAGGGIAGLSAALRLAERGYRVTVLEQKDVLGGNLGSRTVAPDVELDVYPHMYLNWYRNFWKLLDDVTDGGRDRLFAPFSTVRQLAPGAFPHFDSLTNMYSPRYMARNLFAGIGPPADMLLFGYAGLDLLAERLNPTVRLDDMSVKGFLNARPYATGRAIAAMESFITRVWAVPSYLASATDFQEYLRYSLADPTPAFWLPRGSAQRQVIGPLTRALEATGRVEIRLKTQVASVSCRGGLVREIEVQDSRFDEASDSWVGDGERRVEPVEELILAVPALTLSKLIRTHGSSDHDSVVEAAPEMGGVARMRAQQVPLIHLYLKRKLPQIPREPVGLAGNELSLAFTDISQSWEGVPHFAEQTVLAVSSSDPNGLPGTGNDDDAHAMLKELARFLPLDPGTEWGQSPDVDWERTQYNTNGDAQLFINETGTDEWRPRVACRELPNLALAGYFCHSHIGMTTVESAVTTGLQAARWIVRRRGIGDPVEVLTPPTKPLLDVASLYLRYAGAPYVAAATVWSRGSDAAREVGELARDARSLLRRLMAPGGFDDD